MQMTLNQFVRELNNLVQQAKLDRSLSIAKGAIPDMETYHRQCGRIEGMEQAVAMARDMVNTLRDREDAGDLPEMPQTGTDSE